MGVETCESEKQELEMSLEGDVSQQMCLSKGGALHRRDLNCIGQLDPVLQKLCSLGERMAQQGCLSWAGGEEKDGLSTKTSSSNKITNPQEVFSQLVQKLPGMSLGENIDIPQKQKCVWAEKLYLNIQICR